MSPSSHTPSTQHVLFNREFTRNGPAYYPITRVSQESCTRSSKSSAANPPPPAVSDAPDAPRHHFFRWLWHSPVALDAPAHHPAVYFLRLVRRRLHCQRGNKVRRRTGGSKTRRPDNFSSCGEFSSVYSFSRANFCGWQSYTVSITTSVLTGLFAIRVAHSWFSAMRRAETTGNDSGLPTPLQ